MKHSLRSSISGDHVLDTLKIHVGESKQHVDVTLRLSYVSKSVILCLQGSGSRT